MRILYHHRTMADGAEGIHIREIVTALRSLGHEVRVEAISGDPTEPSSRGASRANALRSFIPGFAYEIAELAYNAIGYRRLIAAVREFKPDVIYDRYNSYSTAALNAARRTRVPLLLEVNAPVAYERRVYEHLPLKFSRLANRYERTIFMGADIIFAVSTPLKQHLVEHVGIDTEKIVVLPNGADPDAFVPSDGGEIRLQYGIGDFLVIGFVGILRPWHRVDLLLEAFRTLRSHHPAVHLLIVGDGPIQDQLEAHARNLGLGAAVTFTGRVKHSDIVRYVAAMDVCVSPDATFYASPMKIVEYMAMEKAVVAPAMENIRDLIDDERSGLLFAKGDAASLTAALMRAAGDAELRRELGKQARCRVVARYNWRYNAICIADAAAGLAGRD